MAEKPWYIPEDAITGRSVDPIAAGGFGEVFTASYYGAPVAVKQLYRGYNQNELADFGREIGIWHRLSHPHVLPLLGACDTATKPFMVSPFMPNGTLHNHFVTAPNPRPLSEKVRLLYEIASGMAYLHGNNIVHGDLKSLNVLLDVGYHAVVTDFGMARTKHTSTTANRARRDQPAGGTLDYMAPEMLDEETLAGSSMPTDIYAFGIIVYEVMNDCKPIWVTADGQQMKESVVERLVLRGVRPKQFDGIPDDIRDLIELCWHQDPAMRPGIAAVMARLSDWKERVVVAIAAPGAVTVIPEQVQSDSVRRIVPPRISRISPLADPAVANQGDIPSCLYSKPPVPVSSSQDNSTDTPQLSSNSAASKSSGSISGYLNELESLENQIKKRKEAAEREDARKSEEAMLLAERIRRGNRSLSFLVPMEVPLDDEAKSPVLLATFRAIFGDLLHPVETRVVVTAITLAAGETSPVVIADLFGIPLDTVISVVELLAPVLNPLGSDDNVPNPHADHKTVISFLLGEASLGEPFHVLSRFHLVLATRCLSRILAQEPVINICDIYDFHDKIPDLEDRVAAKITPSLRYSVAHWVTHFIHGIQDEAAMSTHVFESSIFTELAGLLSQLVRTHTFYWLECGSLTHVVKSIIEQLAVLRGVIDKAPSTVVDDTTKELVKDTYRFIREFADPIIKSAPQVYNSGYAFTPKETAIYKTYADQLEDKIPFLVTAGPAPTWGSPVQSTEAYTKQVGWVSVSQDGAWFVSWINDGTIKLWDVATGKLRRTLTRHVGIAAVTISADSKTIVVVEYDCTIKHLDATTGQIKNTFTNHRANEMNSVISPDGTFVAVVDGGVRNRIKIWDTATFSVKHTLEGHQGWPRSLAISPYGKWIASGSSDHTVKVWDTATGQPKHTLKGHTDRVLSVAISPDDKWIASGSSDETIKVWDAATGQLKYTLEGHTQWVNSVVISPDGKWIVSGSSDETIKVWDATTAQIKHTLKGHRRIVNSVAISLDCRLIVSGSSDKTIKVWDATTGQLMHTLRGHTDGVSSVVISVDGKSILSRQFKDDSRMVWVRQGSDYVRSPGNPANFVAPSTRQVPLSSSEWVEVDWDNQPLWIRHGVHATKIPPYLGRPSNEAVRHILPMYLHSLNTQLSFARYLSGSPDPESQARAAAVYADPTVAAHVEEQARIAEERSRLTEEAKTAEAESIAQAEARKAEEARRIEAARPKGLAKWFR